MQFFMVINTLPLKSFLYKNTVFYSNICGVEEIKMNKIYYTLLPLCALISLGADACTGITLKSRDNSVVVARTMDWSGEEMDNMYVIVPRGHVSQSSLPNEEEDGMLFAAKYGYVGIAVLAPEYIIDGTNEAGLSAALFYFPKYGKYQEYNPQYKENTLADFQLVPWILSQFDNIDDVKQGIQNIRVINFDPRAETVHWRITDKYGKQVILEIVNGVPNFYDSELGVLTNAPGYQWHLTNLNNYINLYPGAVEPKNMHGLQLRPLGAGSGFLGLPGDFTPPSRFVRAAFFETYSLQQNTASETIRQAFHILNNFDVPLGVQFNVDKAPNNMPSATQWTIATDLTNMQIYYHTMYNRNIRHIDMRAIDFETVAYQYQMLDETNIQPMTEIQIVTE